MTDQYDEALEEFNDELFVKLMQAEARIEDLEAQLSEAHRQIAILQDQLVHFHL